MTYCEDAYDCAEAADALVIATEWEQFRALDLERLRMTHGLSRGCRSAEHVSSGENATARLCLCLRRAIMRGAEDGRRWSYRRNDGDWLSCTCVLRWSRLSEQIFRVDK